MSGRVVLSIAEVALLLKLTPSEALQLVSSGVLGALQRAEAGPGGEPVEEWREEVTARLDAADRHLERVDLCLTEVRVFLEELLERQARRGLDGWSPEGR